MQKGQASSDGPACDSWWAWRWSERCSGRCAHLSIASLGEDQAGSERRSGGASQIGPSSGQSRRGTCRSERLVAGEHVPDRLGEPAGDIDLGDLGAAVAAEPGLDVLVAGAVGGMPAGVGGGLQQRPAQVLGALFGQRPAPVALPGLVHPRAQAGVAGQLGGGGPTGRSTTASATCWRCRARPTPTSPRPPAGRPGTRLPAGGRLAPDRCDGGDGHPGCGPAGPVTVRVDAALPSARWPVWRMFGCEHLSLLRHRGPGCAARTWPPSWPRPCCWPAWSSAATWSGPTACPNSAVDVYPGESDIVRVAVAEVQLRVRAAAARVDVE